MRIVASGSGRLAVGRALHGRGAWLCAGSEACFELALRRKALARTLRRPVSAEAVATLRDELFGRPDNLAGGVEPLQQ